MSDLLSDDQWLFPTPSQATSPAAAASIRATRDPSQLVRSVASSGSSDQTLALCVLGSGSGGNSTLVHLGSQAMLIDAGFGPVTTARRLGQAKAALQHIKAICLTHLDQDHFRPTWLNTLVGWKIPVYVHQWHQDQLRRLPGADILYTHGLVQEFGKSPFEPIKGLKLHPIRLRHDRQGTCGFLGESDFGRFGYATDLGCVPDELIAMFRGVDLMAIESNYDPVMQQTSTRPANLKRRIMGGAGHLSNQQAFEAVQRVIRTSAPGCPRHIVLLHRSQQCNSRRKVLEVFNTDPAIARRVTLTNQRRRSKWFKLKPQPVPPKQVQMMLTF